MAIKDPASRSSRLEAWHIAALAIVGAIALTPAAGRSQVQGRGGVTGAVAPLGPPRLVVLMAIDQFPVEYVTLYGRHWTAGLHRIFDQGAFYPQAAYPYGTTVTCPGHTAMGSGRVPAVHGLINNTWYDRESKRNVTCTEDLSATSIPLGPGVGVEHHSPKFLMTTSFADELRRQARRPPKIVSISLKPRSAIAMAGHPGPNTMVIWEEDNGTFATSTAYATSPWTEVADYVKSHPIDAAYDQNWVRLLPLSNYLFDDNAPGESTPSGWGRTFPHKLAGDWDIPDETFVTNWEHSPWSDEYLGDMAIALLTKLQLGQTTGTDMLAISFSALDLVGHPYGPRSHEVQDVLLRLDRTIGRVLDALDRLVGRDHYVLALTSDHGVAPIPEQGPQLNLDAGRISMTDLRNRIQSALLPFTGDEPAVAAVTNPNIYLEPGVLQKIQQNRAAKQAVADAVRSVKGVAEAYWADALEAKTSTTDALLRAMRLSYLAGRSGDIVIVPKPYWMLQATGTTHGTPYPYDKQVPVVIMGAGVKAGHYDGQASPLDIAPTFAALTGVKLSRSEGRVLSEALSQR